MEDVGEDHSLPIDDSIDENDEEESTSDSSGASFPSNCFSCRGDAYEEVLMAAKNFSIKCVPNNMAEENAALAYSLTHEFYRNKLLTSRMTYAMNKFEKTGFDAINAFAACSTETRRMFDDFTRQQESMIQGAKAVDLKIASLAQAVHDSVPSIKDAHDALKKMDELQKSFNNVSHKLTAGLREVVAKVWHYEGIMRIGDEAVKSPAKSPGIDNKKVDDKSHTKNKSGESERDSTSESGSVDDCGDDVAKVCSKCHKFPADWFTPPTSLMLEDFQLDISNGSARRIPNSTGLKPFVCPWIISSSNNICGTRVKTIDDLKKHKLTHAKEDFQHHAKIGKVFDQANTECLLHKLFRYEKGPNKDTNHCAGVETNYRCARTRHMAESLHLEDIMLVTLDCTTCGINFPSRLAYIMHYFQHRGSICSTSSDKSRRRPDEKSPLSAPAAKKIVRNKPCKKETTKIKVKSQVRRGELEDTKENVAAPMTSKSSTGDDSGRVKRTSYKTEIETAKERNRHEDVKSLHDDTGKGKKPQEDTKKTKDQGKKSEDEETTCLSPPRKQQKPKLIRASTSSGSEEKLSMIPSRKRKLQSAKSQDGKEGKKCKTETELEKQTAFDEKPDSSYTRKSRKTDDVSETSDTDTSDSSHSSETSETDSSNERHGKDKKKNKKKKSKKNKKKNKRVTKDEMSMLKKILKKLK